MSTTTCPPHDYVGNVRDGWICNKCEKVKPPTTAPQAEEQIRNEINEIITIPYRDRSTEDKQLLLAYNAELLRRHPERNTAPQAVEGVPEPVVVVPPTVQVAAAPIGGSATIRCINYEVTAFEAAALTNDSFLCSDIVPVPALGCPMYFKGMDMSCFDYHLSAHITIWMSAGEESIIYRNDSLFFVYHHLADLTDFSRNKHEDSTVLTTRSDRTDKLDGVSLVHVVEKDSSITEAVADLQRTFRWLPHYQWLPFIFGIAVTSRRLEIFAIQKDGSLKKLFVANLYDVAQRWSCVVAAINLARTLKYFVEKNLVVNSVLRFDTWHERSNKRLRLEISFSEVEFADAATYDRMLTFYSDTASVPHLEHMYLHQANPQKHRICLVPVGVQRMPSSPEELSTCIKHVLTCLHQLHAVGYVHCDVRWSNIISVFAEWYVIDCEYACSLKDMALLSDRSTRIKPRYVMDLSKPWNELFDLYQVGILLEDCPHTAIVPDLVRLRTLLLSKKFTSEQVQGFVSAL